MRRNIIAIAIIAVAILFMAVAIAGSTEPVEEYLEAEIQEATEEVVLPEIVEEDLTEPTDTGCPDCLEYEQILESIEAERYALEQRLAEVAGHIDAINQILGEDYAVDLESEEATTTW